MTWLRIAKFSDRGTVTVDVNGVTYRLTRQEATALRAAIDDGLSDTREFLRTVGDQRPDGAYEVRRRNAESTGHAKVFDSFEELREVYLELPDIFTAEDVRHEGVSGGRRHMLVHHFAEHPQFPCDIDHH